MIPWTIAVSLRAPRREPRIAPVRVTKCSGRRVLTGISQVQPAAN